MNDGEKIRKINTRKLNQMLTTGNKILKILFVLFIVDSGKMPITLLSCKYLFARFMASGFFFFLSGGELPFPDSGLSNNSPHILSAERPKVKVDPKKTFYFFQDSHGRLAFPKCPYAETLL